MVNRYSLPRWVNRGIDALADAPTSVIGRLAARRLGRPDPNTPTTVFDDRPRRVLIAPVNYAGQGRAWARALEAADAGLSARNMAIEVPGGFAFDADLTVSVGTYHNGAAWQRRQLAAASAASHMLIEAEEPPFGRLLGRSVEAQAAALASASVDVAYLAHGTDVRLPSRHREREAWSHYADPDVYAPRAEQLAERNIALLRASGRPLFVATPDLLVDVPGADWIPVAVDPARWAVSERRPRDDGSPLRVAHAPSVGAVKGTALVLPVLERLRDEGVITLDLVQGRPSAEMPGVFAQADVVLDQFRIGSYGVAACEAMAAGCVVVAHLSQDVRDIVRNRSGVDCPIVEATPESLETTLRALAAEDLSARSQASVAFVRALHDGRQAAETLLERWILRPTPAEAPTSTDRTTH